MPIQARTSTAMGVQLSLFDAEAIHAELPDDYHRLTAWAESMSIETGEHKDLLARALQAIGVTGMTLFMAKQGMLSHDVSTMVPEPVAYGGLIAGAGMIAEQIVEWFDTRQDQRVLAPKLEDLSKQINDFAALWESEHLEKADSILSKDDVKEYLDIAQIALRYSYDAVVDYICTRIEETLTVLRSLDSEDARA